MRKEHSSIFTLTVSNPSYRDEAWKDVWTSIPDKTNLKVSCFHLLLQLFLILKSRLEGTLSRKILFKAAM